MTARDEASAALPAGVTRGEIETRQGRFAYLAASPADDSGARDGGGSAPLALCLHGFPDHAPSFAPLLVRLAAAGYRAVAPWMRGYWPSVLHGPYHAEQLAADVAALADALAPLDSGRRAFAVGHDWGALAVHAAIARWPQRFDAAVAMAAPHPLAFLRALRSPRQLAMSWYMLFFQLPGVPERVVARADMAFIDRLWRWWSPGYRLPAAERDALHACLAASLPAPLNYYRALAQPPAAAMARVRDAARWRIATPTLHLHGADDGCIDPAWAPRQQRYFDGPFEAEVLPGAGHFLANEIPDVVAERIADWLARWDARTAG